MASLLLALIYICFISLGLPDSLLGSAWPVMHEQIQVPVSYAGIISMAICVCTILSSLFSDKLLRKFGAGKVTNGIQRCTDGIWLGRFFCQRQLLGADPLLRTLWPWGRRCGRDSE